MSGSGSEEYFLLVMSAAATKIIIVIFIVIISSSSSITTIVPLGVNRILSVQCSTSVVDSFTFIRCTEARKDVLIKKDFQNYDLI